MHVVVASDAQTRVSPKHSQEGVKKHDWQASVNQKNETQCVWRGSIDFLPAIFGHFVRNRRHGAGWRLDLNSLIPSDAHGATPPRRRRNTLAIVTTFPDVTISRLISGSAEASPARHQGQRSN